MKITRKQLRQIIQEEVGLAPDAMARVKSEIIRVLKAEGGAAGLDPIVQAVENAAGEDVNIDVAKFIADEMSDRVTQHSDGDYVEKAGISESTVPEKITKKQLRQIIKETLLLEKNQNPSWNLYSYTGDVWKDFQSKVRGPGGERSKVADAIRDIYINLSSITLQFASVYAMAKAPAPPAADVLGPARINSGEIDRNISEIKKSLDTLKRYSESSLEDIAVLTGDEEFDVANTAVAASTTADDIAVDKRGVQAAADKPQPTTLYKYFTDRNTDLPSKAERASLAKSVGLSKKVQDAIQTQDNAWANTALLKRLLQIEDELAQDD